MARVEVGGPYIEVREEATGRIVMQLLADSRPIDLVDVYQVVLELRDSKGRTYHYSSLDDTPYVGVGDAASGWVWFDPPGGSHFWKAVKSPYKVYWQIYESTTKWYGVPEDREATIFVRESF